MLKVMLIGDSIRLSYRARVAELLAGQAEVCGPDDNCRFSAYTLFNLGPWTEEGPYDVIQWNNGQWDTAHIADGCIHTPLSQYLELQKRIASVLVKRTKRLIFATTTPVRSDMLAANRPRWRTNEDIAAYNAAAVAMLTSMGVEINDLYSTVYPQREAYIVPEDLVHLSPDGVEACAGQVAKVVMG